MRLPGQKVASSDVGKQLFPPFKRLALFVLSPATAQLGFSCRSPNANLPSSWQDAVIQVNDCLMRAMVGGIAGDK